MKTAGTLMLCLALLASRPVLAAPVPGDSLEAPLERQSIDARTSALAGAFLPLTTPARTDTEQAAVTALGSFDQARAAPQLETQLRVRVAGPLALRVGGVTSAERESLTGALGIIVQALSQGRHGLDAAVTVTYRQQGFNLQPALDAGVAVARHLGAATVLMNVAYSHGLRENERSGDVRAAALVPIGSTIYAGIDARARFDLEREQPEPAGELRYDATLGPVLTVPIGRFAVSAQLGAGAVAPHGASTRIGAAGALGVGALF